MSLSATNDLRTLPSSPISKLAPDVLGLIFESNASSYTFRNPSPLTTLIRTSQVCHLWRETILDAAWLWGRHLHFNHPLFGNKSWKREILRRSRDAPLWVEGLIAYPKFFLDIINDEWERIRVIDIRVANTLVDVRQLAESLLRPAPMLEVFIFEHAPHFQLLSTPTLFGNLAPKLRVFRTSDVTFNVDASWVARIEDISFGHNSKLSEILETLENGKAIQHLTLKNVMYGDDAILPNEVPIPMPNLSKIEISGCSFSLWFALLTSISPPENCSVLIICRDEPIQLDVETACQAVLGFVRTSVEKHPARSLSIVMQLHFTLTVQDELQSQFPLTFQLLNCPDLRHQLILRLPSSSLLVTVRRLQLYVEACKDPDIYSSIINLAPFFTSLTTLKASEDTIQFLLEACDPRTSFPKLHTLICDMLRPRRGWPKEWEQRYPFGVLVAFLQARDAAGLPVAVLDLSDRSLKLYDMDFFEQVEGLVVRFIHPVDRMVTEYICGSGHRESLLFETSNI